MGLLPKMSMIIRQQHATCIDTTIHTFFNKTNVKCVNVYDAILMVVMEIISRVYECLERCDT